MLRKINENDKTEYVKMSCDFFSSNAVLHNIPLKNITDTFDMLIKGSPFADAYIIENDGAVAGYVLLSFTYSNEAGGMVVWIEELYVKPEMQGKRLGTDALKVLINHYKKTAARIRLEVEDYNIGAKKLYSRMGFENLDYDQMYIENTSATTL